VRLSIKIAIPSAILAADLSFFLFFRAYFPEAYEFVFQAMPWPDALEKTFVIVAGLVIATATSFSIAYFMLKHLIESIRQG